MQQFQVQRSNFSEHRLVETGLDRPLQPGEVLARVERFAFTANNITYAVAGDMIGYWKFFAAAGSSNDTGSKTWGVIPVWGFAEIMESSTEDVAVGDRLFGYFPPANTLRMQPVKVTPHGFVDGSPHRAELPAGYNAYRTASKSGENDVTADNERALLFPLFMTGFLIWDMLQENKWYGAKQVIILSASSKTSIGLGYALHDDATAPPVIGMTSKGNADFVRSLNLYKSTNHYDQIDQLDASIPTTIVDMAGNKELLGKLHKHFADNMKFCVNVGLTHWDSAAPNPDIIAERSELFFAPGRMQQRFKDWGPAGFEEKISTFVDSAAARCRSWLTIKEIEGLDGLDSIYESVCNGRANPAEGIAIKLV